MRPKDADAGGTTAATDSGEPVPGKVRGKVRWKVRWKVRSGGRRLGEN
jgi:hypothetical protein